MNMCQACVRKSEKLKNLIHQFDYDKVDRVGVCFSKIS